MENSSQLAQRLEKLRSSRLSGSDYYGTASKQLGVSQDRTEGLTQTLRGAEQAFSGLESSIGGRTIGSLVSEAQRRQMLRQEQQPLAERIREQSSALAGEVGSQQSLRDRAREQASQAYQKMESQIGSVQGQYKTTLAAEQQAAKRESERQQFEKELAGRRERLQQLEGLSARLRRSAEQGARAIYGFA